MAAMTYEDWKNSQSSDLNADGYSLDAYNQYLTGMGLAPVSSTGGTSYSPSSSAAGGKTLNVDNTTYQRPAGIPAYNGYQPPNYGNTTPNSTHWLNTMNAYAPTARTDMERLLGQGGGGSAGGGGSSGGLGGSGMTRTPSPITGRPDTGWQTGNTQGAYTPSILTPEQQANPLYKAPSVFPSTGLLGGPTTPAQPATQPTNPFPFQGQNSYMDAFWNVPGSAYAPPTQQQPAYSQPASTQQSSWSNGTVGINPATGSLTFL